MDVQFNESIEDNILTIQPSASCDCEDTFIYKLSSKKSSASGVSSSSQSGRFHLEPNQISYLSQLSFNLENDTQYELHLIITDFNGNTIAEDTLKRP